MMLSPLTASTSIIPANVRFGGKKATELAKENLLAPRQLEAALKQDENPYLGTLPPAFKPANGPDEQAELKVLQALDALSVRLREEGVPKRFEAPELKGLKGKLLGRGAFGAAYRVKVDGKAYAFKIFVPSTEGSVRGQLVERFSRLIRHGPLAEPALGLYFTHHKTRDLAKFYVANPLAKWQLYEFMDLNAAPPEDREGKLLAERGYMFQDGEPEKNSIHGVRIDYGGWLKQTPPGKLLQSMARSINHLLRR